MTSRFVCNNVAGVIIGVGLLSGCGIQSGQAPKITTANYCQAQGSTQAIEQCQQYYARYPGVETPQPAVGRSEPSDLDPHDRAMLIGAFLGQMQQQQQQNYQQQMQFYQRPMPVHQNPTINCTSNHLGASTYTSCN